MSIEQLRAQERDRLEALGVDIDTPVRSLVGRAVERTVEPDEVKRVFFERLAGPDGLTGHRAVFAERDVLVECLATAPTIDDLARWATQPRAERFAHLETEPPQPSFADLYTARDQALAVLAEHQQRQRAVDHAARDRAIVQDRLEQLQVHSTKLEHKRRRAAARTIQLPQRPIRRTTRQALQHQALDRTDDDLARTKVDIDKVMADLDCAQARIADARRRLDDHQPQAADAKRNAL